MGGKGSEERNSGYRVCSLGSPLPLYDNW